MRIVAALALVLLPNVALAYSHSFTNNAKKTAIKVWVNYRACKNDTWTLKPGQVVTWRSGGCCISEVHAQIGSKKVDKYFSAICRNTNWAVEGGDTIVYPQNTVAGPTMPGQTVLQITGG